MPGGAHLSRLPVLLAGLFLLAGCSTVAVDDEDLTSAAATSCRKLVEALPDSIGNLERRDANGDFGAAYGDPPLIIRCGVPDIGLSTAAIEVGGVCWEPVEATGGVVLTTIERTPAIEVLVPDGYREDNSWLVDLSAPLAGPSTACDPENGAEG